MNRRGFLHTLVGSFFLGTFLGRLFRAPLAQASSPPVRSFAFGSCLYQTEPQPIWKGVAAANPDLFTFLGDNIYADTDDMAKMKRDYEILGAVPGFSALRKKIPVIATWDDHDFGKNDGGAEYPMKKQAKELMLNFFGEPTGSERRTREGIYTSYFYGEAPNRLQVILLDLRTFRTPLKERTTEKWGYEANPDPAATMMGSTQWAWLEDQLRQPADLRVLGSSVQCVSSEHEWEKWANFPHEKARLYGMLDRLNIRNLFVISGDMHFAELSMEKTPAGTEVFDLTASGLNVVEKVSVPNSRRIFAKDDFAHFGFVKIQWDAPEIQVSLEIRDSKNKAVFGKKIKFNRG